MGLLAGNPKSTDKGYMLNRKANQLRGYSSFGNTSATHAFRDTVAEFPLLISPSFVVSGAQIDPVFTVAGLMCLLGSTLEICWS